MERYRSGHNEADSKSVVQQCTVGSNPTRSANKDYAFSMVLLLMFSFDDIINNHNLWGGQCAQN